jgi:hypothetical protein
VASRRRAIHAGVAVRVGLRFFCAAVLTVFPG